MSIREQNPLMMDAFTGIYVIQVDVDTWGFPPRGWKFNAIPIYFALDKNGKPTDEAIDGRVWGKDLPEIMAPFLKAFLDNLKN